MYRKLIRPRAEQISMYADVIAKVEQAKQLELFFPYRIQLHVDLQPHSALLQMREARFALSADGHQPPGYRHLHAFALKLRGVARRIFLDDLRNRVRQAELARIRFLPERFDFAQLLPA